MAKKGKVKLSSRKFQIITPSALIYNDMSLKKEVETEAIYGEEFIVSKTKNGYAKGKLVSDNYNGWIKLNNLGFKRNTTHKIITSNTCLYFRPNPKSFTIKNISLGSQITVSKTYCKWSEVQLPIFNNIKKGYIPNNHILKKDDQRLDWVSLAEKLINTPYKWGGKSSFGIDCSGLIQLALQTSCNFYFPRNTSDQVLYARKIGVKVNKIKRGTLIFWKGHVALAINDTHILHANAYHMKTKKELFEEAENRIFKECGAIISLIDICINK